MNIEIIPNWHPLLVHFTIALFSVSALLYLAGLLLNKSNLLIVAKWNLWIGAFATTITVLAGFNAYNSIAHDDLLHTAMTDHKNWALVTVSIFILIALWAGLKHRKATTVSPFFVIIILGASVLLAITGYKGGEVVYRHGGGVMRMPVISEDGGHGSHSHEKNVSADHHGSTETKLQSEAGHHSTEIENPAEEDGHDEHSDHPH